MPFIFRLLFPAAALLSSLSACDSTPKATKAQQENPSVARLSVPPEYRFADFEDGLLQLIPADSPEAAARNAKTTAFLTKQGARTDAGSYAEKSGDDVVDHSKSTVIQGVASIKGTLSKQNGSSYGGVLLITPSGKLEGVHLADYSSLKLILGSRGTHTTLQVRITGTDDQAVFRGCYPVHTIAVTAEPREYSIPLTEENFPQLSWCKDLNLPIAQTLNAVRTVDVQDVNMPEKPTGTSHVEILVGSIRFTR